VSSVISARAVRVLATLLVGFIAACTNETRVDLLARAVGGGSGMPDASAGGGGAGGSAGHGGSANTPDAAPSGSHLIHRYSFSSDPTINDDTYVKDSVGSAHGILKGGATLDGAGHATLDGRDDYVDLPNGLVSSLTDATFVAWLSWNGGFCWQRVFDFGSTDLGEDIIGNATSSVFATPARCGSADAATDGPAAAFETCPMDMGVVRPCGAAGIIGSVDSTMPFPVLDNLPIVVVFDVSGGELRLYAGGELVGAGLIRPLSEISDVNNWLGQSQWIQDPHLRGTYDEFRIYDSALTTAQVAAVERAGPDAVDP